MTFLNQSLLGNSLGQWLTALAIFLLLYLGLAAGGRAALRRLSRLGRLSRDEGVNALIGDLLGRTRLAAFFFIAVWLACLGLYLPAFASAALRFLAVAALVLQAVDWGSAVIDYLARRSAGEGAQAAASATTMNAVRLVAKIALWSVAVLIILQNATGMRLDALLAALGVGGIAVALAVQNILGDLFSAVSIALDKPFLIGDAISVDGLDGTVEHIGLKSTRLRSLSGEQLVLSNSDLLKGRIRNYARMARRRQVITLNLAQETPPEQLAALPGILQEIVSAHAGVAFERAYFKQIGDNALVFECSYYLEITDFSYAVGVLQAINLAILQRFAAEGLRFANPVQTVILQRS